MPQIELLFPGGNLAVVHESDEGEGGLPEVRTRRAAPVMLAAWPYESFLGSAPGAGTPPGQRERFAVAPPSNNSP
jgi:hypothetical protein